MSEKKVCMGCDKKTGIFEIIFYDGDNEIYCADCTANIVRETPEDIEKITPIGVN